MQRAGKVVVVNLTKASDLNGTTGTIVGKCKSGRWIVRLDNDTETEISAKGENLIKLDSNLTGVQEVTNVTQIRSIRSIPSVSSVKMDSFKLNGSGSFKTGVADPAGSWRTSESFKRRNVDAPRLEGFLEKRGEWNPAWKWRYFIANANGDLEYYATDKEGQPIGAPRGVIKFALQQGAVSSEYETEVRPGPQSGPRATIMITIRAPGAGYGRQYVLGARSRTTYDRWLRGLTTMAQAWRKVAPKFSSSMTKGMGFNRSFSESSLSLMGTEPEEGPGSPMSVSSAKSHSLSFRSFASLTWGVQDRPETDSETQDKPRTSSDHPSSPALGPAPELEPGRPPSLDPGQTVVRPPPALPAPAPVVPAGPRMEGTLEKRGVWNTAFKSRYFVFDHASGDLLYYRSRPGRGSKAEAARPAGRIPIAMRPNMLGSRFETLVVSGPFDEDRATIEITVQFGVESGRTYVLGSMDTWVRDDWLRVLAVAAAAWRITPEQAVSNKASKDGGRVPEARAAGGTAASSAGKDRLGDPAATSVTRRGGMGVDAKVQPRRRGGVVE